ncbi:hypothetical protein E2C01_056080 [Portunus trituberculatus]|uniref:Uncharacterized protein n=1 Tax=Portunus trituberculatus TaxID=210409 RepID=A0A5B7GPD7_PORTR|nr:hypothetical protein [Portunus trituberculatus]
MELTINALARLVTEGRAEGLGSSYRREGKTGREKLRFYRGGLEGVKHHQERIKLTQEGKNERCRRRLRED